MFTTKKQQMKRTKLLIVIAILSSTLYISCKSKTPEELIVQKWKIKSIKGPTASQTPDSVMDRELKNAVMEFQTGGNYVLTGILPDAQKGTWSIGKNGKSLTIIDQEKVTETDSIVELSADKLVLIDERGNKVTCIKP